MTKFLSQMSNYTATTTTILQLFGLCLGQPRWAGTRRNIHSLNKNFLWVQSGGQTSWLGGALAPVYDAVSQCVVHQSCLCVCVCKNSVLSGSRGVSVNDQLTAINDCQVSSVERWTQCISELSRHMQHGYCLPINVLHQLDISMNQQCKSVCLSVTASSSSSRCEMCSCIWFAAGHAHRCLHALANGWQNGNCAILNI